VQSQVKFNGVPEKVPEKVWEASVQPVRFNGVPEKVSEKVPEKVLEKVPEKVPGGFGAEPGQVQQGSGQGSREGLGGFGAEPGEVQQGSGKSSGEGSRKPWCKAKSGSTGSGEGCRAGPGEVLGNLWCRARSGQGFQRLASQQASKKFLKKIVAAVGDTTEVSSQFLKSILMVLFVTFLVAVVVVVGFFGMSFRVHLKFLWGFICDFFRVSFKVSLRVLLRFP